MKTFIHAPWMMSDLQFNLLADGRNGCLTAPFEVCLDAEWIDASSDAMLVIPAMFTTDFASVPRLLWALIPPWGPYSPAAVVHDYLCQTGYFPRSTTDLVFRKLMEEARVGWLTRWAMWLGVRLGSWAKYRRYRIRRAEQGRDMP